MFPGSSGKKSRSYDLEIPVVVETEKERRSRLGPVLFSGRIFLFLHLCAPGPLQLAVDPDADLFRRLHPSEVPPMVNSIRGSTSLLVIVAGGALSGPGYRVSAISWMGWESRTLLS